MLLSLFQFPVNIKRLSSIVGGYCPAWHNLEHVSSKEMILEFSDYIYKFLFGCISRNFLLEFLEFLRLGTFLSKLFLIGLNSIDAILEHIPLILVCYERICDEVGLILLMIHEKQVIDKIEFIVRIVKLVCGIWRQIFELINEIVADAAEQAAIRYLWLFGGRKLEYNCPNYIHMCFKPEPFFFIHCSSLGLENALDGIVLIS